MSGRVPERQPPEVGRAHVPERVLAQRVKPRGAERADGRGFARRATVCDMKRPSVSVRPSGTRVGVRQLRQNLSVYLRRVEAGETLEVTEHGRSVAPIRADGAALDRLVAAGLATRPRGDVLDLGLPRRRVSRRASAALEELREERL
jgi:antitoxin (DNA-binding transcriptional repressor) of toxin-antitoxin stability system